jgi:undecaprenyl-phosphate galactose phosphotransferase
MRRERWRSGRLERVILAFADLGVLLLAGCIALVATAIDQPGPALDFKQWLAGRGFTRVELHLSVVLATVVLFWLKRHYVQRKPFWDEFPEIARILLLMGCVDAALTFFSKLDTSRVSLSLTWLLALALVPLARAATKLVLIRLGGWMRPTVVVGCGAHAREAVAALTGDRLLGYQVLAVLNPPPSWKVEQGAAWQPWLQVGDLRLPIYQLEEPVEATFRALGRPQVILAVDAKDVGSIAQEIYRYRESFSGLAVVPTLRGIPLIGAQIAHFFRHEIMLVQVQNNLARKTPQRIKRVFDGIVAGLGLIVLAPLMAAIALAIRRTGQPVLFRHTRVGRHGRPIRCLKFSTMVRNADLLLNEALARDPALRREWETKQKLKNDPRVTPLGAFLRRTSLDELPQLWNVLRGEMSLVGPRPLVEPELVRYGPDATYYLETRPGITGLWQISGRSDTTYERRVALDVWYAKNWTLWYDIVILLKTAREVLGVRGAY